MKEKLLVVFVLLLGIGVMNVSAMTKEELKEKVSKPYTISGITYQARQDDIVQLERYLVQNDLSESDMDYIAEKFDEVVKILEDGNIKSINEITNAQKNSIIAIFDDVANRTSVKVTVDKDTLVIYNQDGTLFTRITFLVKQTGHYDILMPLSLGVTCLGFLVLLRKMRTTHVK